MTANIVETTVPIQEHFKSKHPSEPCPGTTGILIRSDFGFKVYSCLHCQKEGVIPASLPTPRPKRH